VSIKELKNRVDEIYSSLILKKDLSEESLRFEFLKNLLQLSSETLNKSSFDKLLESVNSQMKDVDADSLTLAKDSLVNYSQTTNNIKELTEHSSAKIESLIQSGKKEDFLDVKDEIKNYHNSITKEVDEAEAKIKNLKSKIEYVANISRIDPLTRVLNQNAMLYDLQKVIISRAGRDLSINLIQVNIDNFDDIEIEFGRDAGNKVLIFFGKLLKSIATHSNKVYKLNKSSFIIVKLKSDIKEAKIIADTLYEYLQNNKFIYDDKNLKISLSTGIINSRPNDSLQDLIQRAETAVGIAKTKENKFFIIER